jgi:EAL domain-containing protein (putative c-di-GMP-specific phosphodiesterase class I)/ActR/RegA family two-component response regulator
MIARRPLRAIAIDSGRPTTLDASLPIQIERLRFLVVEDQGFQRWAVEHMLQALGATQIFCAANGQDALEIFRTVLPRVDIVVTDLNMPGMDGIEFIRHIVESGKPASIILMSSQDPALVAAVASMTQAYGGKLLEAMQKPLTAQKLGAAIAKHREPLLEPLSSIPVRVFTLAEIESAIHNDEFEPFFQPKVDLVTGKLKGAEALARWLHPLHGWVMPPSFIGILESDGQMDAMTTSIVRNAAIRCRSWRDRGTKATVSVNISRVLLVDLTLADRLANTIEESGIEPRDVVLEVTETTATSHLGRVLENLSRLRMKGFGLAIDDYGTGYSSMQQLSRIPFTELKIDQSFVRNAHTNRMSRAVIESSLEIAQKLGIDAVAEGVENENEARLLRDLGCRLGQGYYLGRPLPAADFDAWLASGARSAVA